MRGTPLMSQRVGPNHALWKLRQLIEAHVEPYLFWKVSAAKEPHPLRESLVSFSRLPPAHLKHHSFFTVSPGQSSLALIAK